MTAYAYAERRALADLFLALGPDAPTIDEGWDARDLAVHLVVRERRPDAVVGTFVPPLAGHARSVARELAGRPWAELVELVRTPPRLSPLAVPAVHELVNGTEYTIHHEDLRRAQPGWTPRALDPAQQDWVWSGLGRLRRLAFRRAPVGVLLRRTDLPGGATEVMEAASGELVVELAGEPLELLMWSSGRRDAALVELSGDPDATGRLVGAMRGM